MCMLYADYEYLFFMNIRQRYCSCFLDLYAKLSCCWRHQWFRTMSACIKDGLFSTADPMISWPMTALVVTVGLFLTAAPDCGGWSMNAVVTAAGCSVRWYFQFVVLYCRLVSSFEYTITNSPLTLQHEKSAGSKEEACFARDSMVTS